MEASRFTLIPSAAAMALLVASGSANAGVYGFSYDNIFGLTLTNPTGTVAVTNSAYETRNTAILGGTSATNTGTLDAPQATIGPVIIGENHFTPQGPGPQIPGLSYARADSQIISTQFPPFPAGSISTQLVNVAEAHLASPGIAHADGRNHETLSFVVSSPAATISIAFQADPYMAAFLASGGPGTVAVTSLEATFRISNSTGTVFEWAPDGVVNQANILGGTEAQDGANLNLNRPTSSVTVPPGPIYDPTGCLAPTGAGIATSCGAMFFATTNALAAGTYTLEINTAEAVDLVKTAEVPEPGTLALMGLGLAGMCYAGRRKAA